VHITSSFKRQLFSLSPRLRARWSSLSGKFYIEERISINRLKNPEKAKTRDEFIRRRDGYDLVLTVDKLNWRVFASLYYMDIGRFGGALKYADWLEAEEAKLDELHEKSGNSSLDSVSDNAFDKALWLTQNPERAIS